MGKSLPTMEDVNACFNSELGSFVPVNANSKVFYLGNPSNILLSVGVEDKPIKLYGNKLLKKMRKHNFKAIDLMNLPNYIADPIAIFEGGRLESFSILTEAVIEGHNALVILESGKDSEIHFNMITSTYGKSGYNIKRWINEGRILYVNNEKAPDYFGTSAPIADAGNQELINNIQNSLGASE